MILYHATNVDCVDSILEAGLKAGWDGVVYTTKREQDALKFVTLRFWQKVAVIKVKIPSKYEKYVEETFDHSYAFFKCRAFGYKGDIPAEWIQGVTTYDMRLKE